MRKEMETRTIVLTADIVRIVRKANGNGEDSRQEARELCRAEASRYCVRHAQHGAREFIRTWILSINQN